MADFSFVRDEAGRIRGVWVRNASDAHDNPYVVTLFLRGGLSPEEIAGTLSVVPNSANTDGGCFVMLGSSPAPGESQLRREAAADHRVAIPAPRPDRQPLGKTPSPSAASAPVTLRERRCPMCRGIYPATSTSCPSCGAEAPWSHQPRQEFDWDKYYEERAREGTLPSDRKMSPGEMWAAIAATLALLAGAIAIVGWAGYSAFVWLSHGTGTASVSANAGLVIVAAACVIAMFAIEKAGATAGAFGGAIAGVVSAGIGANPIGAVGFVCFLLFVGPLPGAGKKAVGAISFGTVAALTSALFRG